MATKITQHPFDEVGIETVRNLPYGNNWPVVYIINNEKEAYVGETTGVYQRMKQHKANRSRMNLKKVRVIYDDEFNKSAILDIESLLINYMLADQQYKLQNVSSGINSQSEYYQRDKYLAKFDDIWNELIKEGLARQKRIYLENLDIFKFSPYKTLNEEQHSTAMSIVKSFVEFKAKDEKASFVVKGSPGTGKSVLAVYLMKLFSEFCNSKNELSFESMNSILFESSKIGEIINGDLKIALVIPMVPLRNTLKSVFKDIPGLKANMVIGPSEVIKKHYDILIVDEAHRLRRRVNLQPNQYHVFDKINKQLNLEDGNELDWIIECSDYQILFYDPLQSIKPSDIRKEKFQKLMINKNTLQYSLTSQMRVQGGEYYISAMYKLLTQTLTRKIHVENYDLKIFDDIENMYQEIRKKDCDIGLSRMVAGYAWKWKTQNEEYKDIKRNNLYDIDIEDYKYIWNHSNKDWVNSKNAISEIGCIHTIQGYDLNYVGVIIGPELKYDMEIQKVYIDKSHYFDRNGKNSIKTDDELHDYIVNIYNVLLTRGIKGTYIYICDNGLKQYFKEKIGV